MASGDSVRSATGRRAMLGRVSLVAALVVALSLLTVSASSGSPTQNPKRGNQLTLGITVPPVGLNPAKIWSGAQVAFISPAYDSYVYQGSRWLVPSRARSVVRICVRVEQLDVHDDAEAGSQVRRRLTAHRGERSSQPDVPEGCGLRHLLTLATVQGHPGRQPLQGEDHDHSTGGRDPASVQPVLSDGIPDQRSGACGSEAAGHTVVRNRSVRHQPGRPASRLGVHVHREPEVLRPVEDPLQEVRHQVHLRFERAPPGDKNRPVDVMSVSPKGVPEARRAKPM